VCIPSDVSGAVRPGRHRGLPIVSGRFAHAHFSGPGPLRQRAQEYVALSISITLPREENLTVGRRRRAQECVRSLRRQALGSLPALALFLASPNLPAVVIPLAPEDPLVPFFIGRDRATEQVGGSRRHFLRRRPGV